MSGKASLINVVSIVYSTVCSGADQGRHQSSASLACVCVWEGGGGGGIHRWFPAQRPVTRKKFAFGDVTMAMDFAALDFLKQNRFQSQYTCMSFQDSKSFGRGTTFPKSNFQGDQQNMP